MEAALYLFWLRGYAATGIAEILQRAKANAGSFYYCFKTKEELLLAVLLERREYENAFEVRPDGKGGWSDAVARTPRN